MLATCSRICPSLQQRPPLSFGIRTCPAMSSNVCKPRGHHVSSFATGGGTGQGNAYQRFLAGKSADARSELGTAPGAKSGTRWRTRASELDHRRPSVPPPGGGSMPTRASRQSKKNVRASTFRKWRFASFLLTAQTADSAKRWRQNSNFKA